MSSEATHADRGTSRAGARRQRAADLLNPFVWASEARSARRIHGFALAERASMIDLRLAASLTPSPTRAALYLQHADDEARHAEIFAREARRRFDALGDTRVAGLDVDCEQLFERLGERAFVAFVHHGEARGCAQFRSYVRWFRRRGDTRMAALFETILGDELRHEDYTGALLLELAGDQRRAAIALRQVRRWELWRGWLRMGRALTAPLYAGFATLLYFAAAPLALLVRWARPRRPGFRSTHEAMGRAMGRAVGGDSDRAPAHGDGPQDDTARVERARPGAPPP